MSHARAWEALSLSKAFAVLAGYEVEDCACQAGFTATVRGQRRSMHVERLGDERDHGARLALAPPLVPAGATA
jgi:hypothetical protein